MKTPPLTLTDTDEYELEWDESPEQFQLSEEYIADQDDRSTHLQPRRLFSEHSVQLEDNTTGKPIVLHKLQRRNAMRRK